MSVLYSFQGGNHFVKFHIGNGRSMSVATELTGFKMVVLEKVFPNKTIKELQALIENFDEDEFEAYVIKEFEKMGYKLVKREEV